MKYKKKNDLALKIFLPNEKQDINNFLTKTNYEINLMRNILHFNIIRSFYKIKDNGKFMGVLMEEYHISVYFLYHHFLMYAFPPHQNQY